MAVEIGQWLDLVQREYAQRYLSGGGSAVKFIIAGDEELAEVQSRLKAMAAERGMLFAAVDSASTKLSLVQNFFFAIARSIDWEHLAQRRAETMLKELGYQWPSPGQATTLGAVARQNDVAEQLIGLNVDQWLTKHILTTPEMMADFRLAMARLCRLRLSSDAAAESAPVLEWLRGDLSALGALRPVPIGSKINRNNAHAAMRSLCHWLVRCGYPGLVVCLDLRWIAENAPSTSGVRYTPAAIFDVFEVLRQLIDESAAFEGLFLAVGSGPALLEGEHRRTIDVYPALKGRIGLDVLATQHDNPLAPLVRLARLEQVPHLIGTGQMPYAAERAAIESLRAGVPNEAAIRMLDGVEQPWSETFVGELRSIAKAATQIPIFPGRIAVGGFGTGKSHLLGYLAEHAKNQNFIVSQVSISKETPLFNLDRVFSAAIRSAIVPGINNDVMTEVIDRLAKDPSKATELEEWSGNPSSGLSPIFPALVHVIAKNILAPEDKVAVARFFAGARLRTGSLGQWLKQAGVRRLFDIRPVKAADLGGQRLAFTPHLLRAAGFSGWCVLLDEIELIGRYSSLQRAKSYGELARWLGLDHRTAVPGMIAVGTIVDDYKSRVLEQRRDDEVLPSLLEGKGLPEQARLAEIGMKAIEAQAFVLAPPGVTQLERSLSEVARLYQRSYGWKPVKKEVGERRAGKTMREFIKSWIIGWDIERLYGITPEIIVEKPDPVDYTENKNLEAPPPVSPGEEDD